MFRVIIAITFLESIVTAMVQRGVSFLYRRQIGIHPDPKLDAWSAIWRDLYWERVVKPSYGTPVPARKTELTRVRQAAVCQEIASLSVDHLNEGR